MTSTTKTPRAQISIPFYLPRLTDGELYFLGRMAVGLIYARSPFLGGWLDDTAHAELHRRSHTSVGDHISDAGFPSIVFNGLPDAEIGNALIGASMACDAAQPGGLLSMFLNELRKRIIVAAAYRLSRRTSATS